MRTVCIPYAYMKLVAASCIGILGFEVGKNTYLCSLLISIAAYFKSVLAYLIVALWHPRRQSP